MEPFLDAKALFQSDSYVLLPRQLRLKLVRYLVAVMVDIERPYETLPKIASVSPFMPKRYNCRDYLDVLKSLIEQDDKDLKNRLDEMQRKKKFDTEKELELKRVRDSMSFDKVDAAGLKELKNKGIK